MTGLVIAGILATALVVPLSRLRRWRKLARSLYESHRIAWEEAPQWRVVDDDDAEAWREASLSALAAELRRFGFQRAGLIQNANADRLHGGEPRPLTIFAREQGDVHAASCEMAGRDSLELETEFTDGHVVGTSDFPAALRLSSPAEIDLVHLGGASPADLFAKHQERVQERARSSSAPIRPAHSLDEVIASQVRQHELRRRYRAPLAYISDAEFEQIADTLGLSSWGRREVLKEYRAVAATGAARAQRWQPPDSPR